MATAPTMMLQRGEGAAAGTFAVHPCREASRKRSAAKAAGAMKVDIRVFAIWAIVII